MNRGLYLHVPYCRRVCPYCDFFVVPVGRRGRRRGSVEAGRSLGRPDSPASRRTATPPGDLDDFVDGLIREIELATESRETLATIHLGGGTPSTLTGDELARILGAVRERFAVESGAEVAIEANPEDLTTDYAAVLVELGVNRVTLGVQSLDDSALKLLGRKHRRAQALAALAAARAGGIRNLGVDLIFGVPGQSVESWHETLDRVLDVSPEHLSCYELTIEEGTELDRQRASGKVIPATAEVHHRLFVETHERLTAAGYEHYEVSNFAREPSLRSHHNLGYWRHRPYLGVGPSAHSFDGRARWWNHRSLDGWLADIEGGRLPIAGSEELSALELRREEILLGLRCIDGFPVESSGRGPAPPLPQRALADAVARGYLVIDDDHVKPTFAGMTIADELARQLCP